MKYFRNTKKHALLFSWIFLCVFSSAIFAQEPPVVVGITSPDVFKTEIKEPQPDPQLEKPDYSGLPADANPLFVETLEKMRTLYNRLRLMDSRRYPWFFAHDFETAQFGPKSVAGDLAYFLREAGLQTESEKIVALFPPESGRAYFQYSVEEYIENKIPIRDLLFAQQLREAEQRKPELYAVLNRLKYPTKKDGFFLLSSIPPQGEPRKFERYKDWAKAYIELSEPDLEKALEQIEQVRNNTQMQSSHYCDTLFSMAILFHFSGRETDAENALEFAHEVAVASERATAKHYKKELTEPVFPNAVNYWSGLISYHLRLEDYEKAKETLAQMKKGYVGQGGSQTQSWNEQLTRIVYALCRNGRFDEGMTLMDDYIDTNTGRAVNSDFYRAYENLANSLAGAGLKAESQKVMLNPKFPQGKEANVRYESAKYTVRTASPEKGHAALRQLLETSLDGTRFGVPSDIEKIREIGMLFLKYGDQKNAKSMFDLHDAGISDSIKKGKCRYPSIEHNAKWRAEAYRAGYEEPLLDYFETFHGIPRRTLFLCFLVDHLGASVDAQTAREFLEKAYDMSLQVAPNPGIVQDQSIYSSINPTQNDLLKSVACSALIAGELDLARKAMHRSDELDAKLPNAGRVEPRNNGEMFSRDERLFLDCHAKIMASPTPNLEAAILAADRIVQLKAQYDAYKKIVVKMLF